MSTEEALDISTETPEGSEASAEELSLQSIHSISDEELDSFITNDFKRVDVKDDADPDAEDSMSEQNRLATEQEAEPPSEEAEDGSENELESEASGSEEVNYEAVYKDIFAPFKANGREMQVETAEEVKRLMQQGVNYHKNMEKLKPHKQLLSLIEKRGGIDPEKLSFLLDVSEGKPEAIAKLLKDNELNPYDIDVEDGEKYESTYTNTEATDTITEVFESISSGEAKLRTLELFSGATAWDDDSRTRIYKTPESIKLLHNQIADGTFDTIMSVVEKKKALGEMIGVADLDAYNMVGSQLAEQGKLGVPNTPTESSTTSSPKQKEQSQNLQRKKAGGSPRNAPSNVPSNSSKVFNPATASDEEVEKFLQDHLLKSVG